MLCALMNIASNLHPSYTVEFQLKMDLQTNGFFAQEKEISGELVRSIEVLKYKEFLEFQIHLPNFFYKTRPEIY